MRIIQLALWVIAIVQSVGLVLSVVKLRQSMTRYRENYALQQRAASMIEVSTENLKRTMPPVPTAPVSDMMFSDPLAPVGRFQVRACMEHWHIYDMQKFGVQLDGQFETEEAAWREVAALNRQAHWDVS